MIYSYTDACTIITENSDKRAKCSLLKGYRPVLIDLPCEEATDDFFADLETILPASEVHVLILTHFSETNRVALAKLLEARPKLWIICTDKCKARIKDMTEAVSIQPIPDFIEVQIGSFRFFFIHSPGLAHRENLCIFYGENDILFCGELFGQYVEAESPFEEEVTPEGLAEGGMDYLKRVISPLTEENKILIPKLLRREPKCIAPSVGVILEDKKQIVTDLYH